MNIGTVIALIKALGGSGGAPAVVGKKSAESTASVTDGAAGKPITDLVIGLTPKQAGSGTPSPDNVRAVSGHTGVTVTMRGKNLIDQATATEYPRWINDSDKWATSTGGGKSFAFPCEASTTYTVSLGKANSVFRVGYIESAIPTSSSTKPSVYDVTRTTGPGSVTITTSASAKYIVIQLGASILRTSDLQIELGSKATEYEPYSLQEKTYDWSDTAGTVYYATLDVNTGILTDYSAAITLSGGSGEAWDATVTGASANKYFRLKVGDEGDVTDDAGVCDQYAHAVLTSSNTDVGFRVYNSTSLHNAYVAIRPSDVTNMSVTDFKTALAGAPVTVAYRLTEPRTYQLEPARFTIPGNTFMVWAGDGTVDSLEYTADTKAYIDQLLKLDADMVAEDNITSGDYFMVGNTLYLATANIAQGADIVPGTNCTETSIAEALNTINS